MQADSELSLMERMERVESMVRKIARESAINHNLQSAAGKHSPFSVVLFRDGSDPTAPPHNLPGLTNVNVVERLAQRSSTAYYRGYYGDGNLPPHDERITLIIRAIGSYRIMHTLDGSDKGW